MRLIGKDLLNEKQVKKLKAIGQKKIEMNNMKDQF